MRRAGCRRRVSMTFCLGLIIARILIVAALTVIKELTNQIFQHHGGLGVPDSAAVFKDSRPEVRVFKTDVQRRYCSPSRPEVRIANELVSGIWL